MTDVYNHTTLGGEQFVGPYRIGTYVGPLLPYPGETPPTYVTIAAATGREDVGLYPLQDVDTSPPDAYYRQQDPSFLLALVGPEYTAGSVVQRTYLWETLSNAEIADQKYAELDNHVSFLSLQSALLTESPNFWIALGSAERAQYASRGNLSQWRVKDRTLGRDSKDPGTIEPAATFWPNNDPTIRLIRNSNGNIISTPVTESSYGGVLKDIESYDTDINQGEYACEQDIDAAKQADDRALLVAIDVTNPVYNWPDYYQGPQSIERVVITRREVNGMLIGQVLQRKFPQG